MAIATLQRPSGTEPRTVDDGRPAPRRRSGIKPRKSWLLTALMSVLFAYSMLPLFWLVVSSTKTQGALASSFGLWFSGPFAFWDNVVQVFTYQDGTFGRWVLNTILYTVVGAIGSTFLATLGGYGLAKFDFPGKRVLFAVIIGAVAVPGSALAVPTFLLFSQLGLTNTPWAVFIPSLVSSFGLFLMWSYSREAVPNELLEAARMDGAGEFRTFFTISSRLLAPGVVSVLLLDVVGTWNNYFLPLIMLSDPKWYPLTVGLNQWSEQANTAGGETVFNLVITGSLLTIVPLIIAFLFLQRFWQSGLAAGSVKA
ncbi:carbohydrate ABC transporter permease [Leifsonia aquatica]|uniref:carbohydrate ABC transporter permease n=1 Tax=Leifsonia aquatica TaxID=144185 RepID=UPI00384C986B